MGIDKCTSRCLILCPHLFERCFDETFPVTIDARRLTPMPTSFTAVARDMKLEYDKQQWDSIAAWNPHCSASVPYPLFKLKGDLATCADVYEKKGKCCRNRPVVPTTGHPARRLLIRGRLCAFRPIWRAGANRSGLRPRRVCCGPIWAIINLIMSTAGPGPLELW